MIRLATALVVQVVDGDTLHAHLDIGWGLVLRPRGLNGGAGTIRVVHPDGSKFDAPESRTARGRTVTELVQRMVLPGQELDVISHGLDDFGRTLGSVTWMNGRDWATELTKLGLTK